MVHTLPDYSTKYRLAKVFGNIDDSELAARLGASSLFDRRGNYYWHDNFEGSTLKWKGGITAQDATVALCADTCFMGSQCCKLVTGGDNNDVARVEKKFYLPSDSNLGLEIMVNMADVASNFRVTGTGYNGTNLFQASLEWRQATNNLWIYDEPTGWTSIGSSIIPTYDDHLWLPFKLVFDWDTKYYTRAIVGSTEYDISSYEIAYGANASDPYLQVYIQYQALSADIRTAYIDNFIITQNDV